MAQDTDLLGFKETLKSEHGLIQQFVELLAREQDGLSHGKIDDLTDFAKQKGMLATRLNELAEKRNAFLRRQGYSGDKSGIESWCKENSDAQGVVKLWSDILSLAAEAREMNRLNGDLIRIHMHQNSKALEILLGGNDTLHLYGPDGQSMATEGRRINDAV